MSYDIIEVEAGGEKLALRGNKASRGVPAHVSVSRAADGELYGRVFAHSVTAAWEAASADRLAKLVNDAKAKVAAVSDTAANGSTGESDARSAALARLTQSAGAANTAGAANSAGGSGASDAEEATSTGGQSSDGNNADVETTATGKTASGPKQKD